MTTAPTPFHGPRASHRFQLALIAAIAVIAIGALVLVLADVFPGSSSSKGVRGSGAAAAQTRDLAAFNAVDLAGSNVVTIHVGGRQSVVVHADDNLLSRITTRVKAGSLVIGNTPGAFTSKSPMSVNVGVPSLTALALSGSGVVSTTGVTESGLTVRLSGSGVIHASGSVTRLNVVLDGSGDARLEHLVASDVHAVVSGSGRILLTATKTLDASVTGSGAIVYRGNPAHVTTGVTGVGAITRG